MLSKLIRYNLKDAVRSMLPISLGMLALSVFSSLLTTLALNRLSSSSLPGMTILSGLIDVLTVVCFIAVMVICLASSIGRFYRMLGRQGYLELSLPVTLHQHIAAKLISAVITTVLTIAFLFLCCIILMMPMQSANWLNVMFGQFMDYLHNAPVLFNLLLILFMLASIAMFYLHTYLSCAIGGFFPQRRKLMSIVAFFLLQVVSQVIMIWVVSFAFNHMQTLISLFQRFAIAMLDGSNGELKLLYGSMAGAVVIEVLIDAVLWLITRTILTKSLNLP